MESRLLLIHVRKLSNPKRADAYHEWSRIARAGGLSAVTLSSAFTAHMLEHARSHN